jgi:hypothetical protein
LPEEVKTWFTSTDQNCPVVNY